MLVKDAARSVGIARQDFTRCSRPDSYDQTRGSRENEQAYNSRRDQIDNNKAEHPQCTRVRDHTPGSYTNFVDILALILESVFEDIFERKPRTSFARQGQVLLVLISIYAGKKRQMPDFRPINLLSSD